MPQTDGRSILSHEIQVCHLGTVPYRDALALQHKVRARRLARRATRRAAAARTPSRLHPRAPLGAGRADAGRGLLPRARHRDRADRPWRARHLPRPRAAGRLPDHARHGHRRASAHDGVRDRRRAERTTASRPTPAARRDPTTRVSGSPTAQDMARDKTRRGAPQDRLDRRARLARDLHPRVCGQRRQRSDAIHVDRRLRAARCHDDFARARASPRAHAGPGRVSNAPGPSFLRRPRPAPATCLARAARPRCSAAGTTTHPRRACAAPRAGAGPDAPRPRPPEREHLRGCGPSRPEP